MATMDLFYATTFHQEETNDAIVVVPLSFFLSFPRTLSSPIALFERNEFYANSWAKVRFSTIE